MSILGKLLSFNLTAPIEALGNAVDNITTTDEERLKAQIALEKLKHHAAELQVELNKIEAGHKSLFVAGWRPCLGWICGLSILYEFFIRPLFNGFCIGSGIMFPGIEISALYNLTAIILGAEGLRTYEKSKKI